MKEVVWAEKQGEDSLSRNLYDGCLCTHATGSSRPMSGDWNFQGRNCKVEHVPSLSTNGFDQTRDLYKITIYRSRSVWRSLPAKPRCGTPRDRSRILSQSFPHEPNSYGSHIPRTAEGSRSRLTDAKSVSLRTVDISHVNWVEST